MRGETTQGESAFASGARVLSIGLVDSALSWALEDEDHLQARPAPVSRPTPRSSGEPGPKTRIVGK